MKLSEIGVSFECLQKVVNEIRIAYISVGQIPSIVSTHSSLS